MIAAIELSALGIATSFAVGLVSFASPCVWPLVPAYLSYVSGVGFEQLAERTNRVVLSTAFFVLGFGSVFTLAGVGAGVFGDAFLQNRRALEIVGGVAVILMGLVLAGLAGGLLQRERRMHLPFRPSGPGGATLAGMAFAIGWTPCIGPTLTAILALAATEGGALDGAILLAAYSAGLGVPFLLSGLFVTGALARTAALRRHSRLVMRAAGALLVVTGVLLATGTLTEITQRLSGFLPELAA